VPAHQLVAVPVAVAAPIAAGIAVAATSAQTAFFVILIVSAALFFAFARSTLGQTYSRRVRLSKARSSRDVDQLSSETSDAGFRLSRWLYYVGVVLLGVLTLRAGGQVAVSDALFLLSFLLACAELVLVRRQVTIRLPFLLLLGMVIFSVGGLVSTFQSYEYVRSTGIIVRLILLTVFWFWLGTVVLSRREHVMKATNLWVASAAIGGGAAIVQLLIGDVIPGTAALGGRMTGFTGHPNDLGALASIAFVPALMLAARQTIPAPRRLFSYALLLLVAAGLILSVSVGAILAAAVATFVWFAFQRSSVHSILVFATIGLCAIAITTAQAMRGAPTPLERYDMATSPEEAGGGSLQQRIVVYRTVARAIEDNPFVGVGLDLTSVTRPFGEENYQYDVHNLIIGIWYKAGLFGLVGMLLAFFAVFRTGWTTIMRSTSESERRLAVALVSSAVAFITYAMSAPALFSRYGWISAALLFALRAVQLRRSHAAEASAYTGDVRGVALAPARS
jgi:O-antigen ligase